MLSKFHELWVTTYDSCYMTMLLTHVTCYMTHVTLHYESCNFWICKKGFILSLGDNSTNSVKTCCRSCDHKRKTFVRNVKGKIFAIVPSKKLQQNCSGVPWKHSIALDDTFYSPNRRNAWKCKCRSKWTPSNNAKQRIKIINLTTVLYLLYYLF